MPGVADPIHSFFVLHAIETRYKYKICGSLMVSRGAVFPGGGVSLRGGLRWISPLLPLTKLPTTLDRSGQNSHFHLCNKLAGRKTPGIFTIFMMQGL
ncbi:hypothetical protein MBAV_006176 [Candidatus Magnetobacterium bavaricum]|uniref:Uncharacterized protein n=1 Tax=Candidatus Magnetobacterium bavaricum TaxID=29290 RepID=A0A0F3GLQ4_9BACT|nr:hypothetical protein MBAV_006176 [Candidatus Magnetobacterium bavaricum]